ncbi:MAG: hypothetical protein ACJ78U_18170 [Myxococcales bacterium]
MRVSNAPRCALRPLALVALACAACSNDLEKQSEIVKLRVLAVSAEPADLVVSQGQPPPRTTLTALAVEPSGAPVTMRFALCTEQSATPAPDLDCPGAQGIDLPPSGSTSAILDLGDPRIVAFAQSADAGVADGGSLPSGGIPVVVGFEASAPAHTLPDGGPAGADGGPLQIVRGFTLVDLHDDSRPTNRNPRVDALLVAADGGPDLAPDGSVPVGTVQRLTPVPAPDAKERVPGGAVESLGYSFFATAGSLSSLRSTDTTATGEPADTFVDWNAPADPGPVRMWVVVRDGRGGTGWLERDFSVAR